MTMKEPGRIVPAPQQVKARSGRLRLRSGAAIVLGLEAENSDLATAQALQQPTHFSVDIGAVMRTVYRSIGSNRPRRLRGSSMKKSTIPIATTWKPMAIQKTLA